jgi:hypothetical protein
VKPATATGRPPGATTNPAAPFTSAAWLPCEGFLTGLNDVLTLGGLVSLAGAVLALWLVREREIERRPIEPEPAAARGRQRRPAEAV